MTIKREDVEHIFKDYYPRLYYHALTYIDDSEICKDMVSDVFESLWEECGQLRHDTLKAYLYACVRNRCINYLRHQQIENQYMALMEQEPAPMTDREEDERLVKIRQIIDTMPRQRRFVLEACFFQKKTYKEVAAILGITTDGVKKHIVTALKQLRSEFLSDKVPEKGV